MPQIPEIPPQVRIVIRAEETVESFCRRALTQVAFEAGLPLIERGLFVDALIERYPKFKKTYWLGNSDPTKRTDTEVRTEDFNFKLFLEYLREHPGGGKRKVSIKQVKPFEGKAVTSYTPDEITRNELILWQQDFIYRGGELGTGREVLISRQGLVPALQVAETEPNVTWLPQIMRKNGWTQGAILLEEWLRRPAKIRPATMAATPKDFGPPVLNVVTMDWILSFDSKPAVNNTYNQLIKERLWKNEAAKSAIGTMLARTGITAQAKYAPDRKIKFGDLTSSNVIEIEGVHIQSREVKIFSYYDGLTAAIANFSFHVAIKGEASYTQKGLEVTVEEIGIYAKDSYDYINDGTLYLACLCYDQPLGDWGKDVGYIHNSSFNNWRTANKKGGDFLVYSDIKVIKITPPDTFIVPSQ